MNISLIMTKIVVTVEMDDSLKTINEIFARSRFHHVLVVEQNKLRGIILFPIAMYLRLQALF